jgi:predicted CoA-binding protein
MKVAVLGASDNKYKYSNMAVQQLAEQGHEVFPIHPQHKEVAGLKALPTLSAIETDVHTLTVYLNSQRSEALIEDIILLKPERVILNPGAESALIVDRLKDSNIKVIEACTLVLLHTQQF